MTLLSKKISEVRQRHSDQHGAEQAQVLDLDAQLRRQDEQLIADLDDVLAGHAERRAVIHRKLVTVAQCVGLLPPAQDDRATQALDRAIDGVDVSTAYDPPLPRILRSDADRTPVAH